MEVIILIISHKCAFVAPGAQAFGIVVSDDLVYNGLCLPGVSGRYSANTNIQQGGAGAIDVVVIAQETKKIVGSIGRQGIQRNRAFPARYQVGIVADAVAVIE